MNTIFLYAASAAAALTTAAHIFIGGKKNARPIFQTEGLLTGPRVTVEFAWHAASVFLAFVALIYLWAAITGKGDLMVRFTTVHCAILALLGGFVASTGNIAPWQFPPTVLFVIVSVFGTLAITT